MGVVEAIRPGEGYLGQSDQGVLRAIPPGGTEGNPTRGQYLGQSDQGVCEAIRPMWGYLGQSGLGQGGS